MQNSNRKVSEAQTDLLYHLDSLLEVSQETEEEKKEYKDLSRTRLKTAEWPLLNLNGLYDLNSNQA